MNARGRTALVTGANRGLGLELVRALLDAGAARVYAAAREPTTLTRTLALDRARVRAVQLDVTDPDQIDGAARLADVDLLINNAGVLLPGEALDVGFDAVERTFAVNLLGPWRLTRALTPVLVARRGAVVNVLSLLALSNAPFASAYCASKHALHAVTQSLCGELASRGVSVIGVYPGGIDTEMLAGVHHTKTPPADVARAIVAGLNHNESEIFPDPVSKRFAARRAVAHGWA